MRQNHHVYIVESGWRFVIYKEGNYPCDVNHKGINTNVEDYYMPICKITTIQKYCYSYTSRGTMGTRWACPEFWSSLLPTFFLFLFLFYFFDRQQGKCIKKGKSITKKKPWPT